MNLYYKHQYTSMNVYWCILMTGLGCTSMQASESPARIETISGASGDRYRAICKHVYQLYTYVYERILHVRI